MDPFVSLIRRNSRRLRLVPAGIPCSGSLPRVPRAVLFDVYGTLLLRVPRAAGSVGAFLRSSSLRLTPVQLSDRLSHAVAAHHEHSRARGISFPEVRIERIWGMLFPGRSERELRRLAICHELAAHSCWPMPGCPKVIESISGRGVLLGIVSNAQFYTPLFLQAFFQRAPEDLGFRRSLCIYSYRYGAGKPGPVLYELARERLGRLGIPSREVVMVGNDPSNDVTAAARAGFMTVLLAGDRRMRSPIDGSGTGTRPDAVIDRLSSLIRLIRHPGA